MLRELHLTDAVLPLEPGSSGDLAARRSRSASVLASVLAWVLAWVLGRGKVRP
jgi:hypothetical protein